MNPHLNFRSLSNHLLTNNTVSRKRKKSPDLRYITSSMNQTVGIQKPHTSVPDSYFNMKIKIEPQGQPPSVHDKAAELRIDALNAAERKTIRTKRASMWGGLLETASYLEREEFLENRTLTKDGGLSTCGLVHRRGFFEADKRPVYASCETMKVRAFVMTGDKDVREVTILGITNVFCAEEHRGKGYAGRMMKKLGSLLGTYYSGCARPEPHFTVLWSDIGKDHYAKRGWKPHSSKQLTFKAETSTAVVPRPDTKLLISEDLEGLCVLDEMLMRKRMKRFEDGKTHVAIVPSTANLQWHMARDDFVADKLLSVVPRWKGAASRRIGERFWAIWRRDYQSSPNEESEKNVLHVLRLVIEDEAFLKVGVKQENESMKTRLEEAAECIQNVFDAARREAAAWNCSSVVFWNPSPLVKELVDMTDLSYVEERKDAGIPSLRWNKTGICEH